MKFLVIAGPFNALTVTIVFNHDRTSSIKDQWAIKRNCGTTIPAHHLAQCPRFSESDR
jgi:hypothetical protein